MYCTNCGKQFDGKFCPECGTAAHPSDTANTDGTAQYDVDAQTFSEETNNTAAYSSPIQQPSARPPKKKKHGCLIAIAVFLVIGIIGSVVDSKSEDSSSSSSRTSSASQSSSTISDNSNISSTSEKIPVDNTLSDISTSEAEAEIGFDVVISVLKISLSDSYGENYKIDGDETGITISIWEDGIAAGATLAKAGNEQLIESWNYMAESLVEMSKSTKESITDLGFPDTTVMINLLNDGNLDNILLIIVDGEVLYDCTTE